MPAMFTFYYGFSALLCITLFIIITIGSKKPPIIPILAITIAMLIIYSYPWSRTVLAVILAIPFVIFINLFPSYVVLLIAALLMFFIPSRVHIAIRITIFLILSFLIGLNTKLISVFKDLVTTKSAITETIYTPLQLSENDVIQLDNLLIDLPYKYNSYDFISFGGSEANMNVYWSFPYSYEISIPRLLQAQMIAYTPGGNSTHRLKINASREHDRYSLQINVMDHDKVLSSFHASDTLPTSSRQFSNQDLDNFECRLEYLLRHNLWNYLIYLMSEEKNLEKKIKSFLEKSIKTADTSQKWLRQVHKINAELVDESSIQRCSDTKDVSHYDYMKWKSEINDDSVKYAGRSGRITFEHNSTIRTVKKHSKSFTAYNFTYPTNGYKYLFESFSSAKSNQQFSILKFTEDGHFLEELEINLPSNILWIGTENPSISHVDLHNNLMTFRIYDVTTITEDRLPLQSRNNTKKRSEIVGHNCKYYLFQVELPQDIP